MRKASFYSYAYIIQDYNTKSKPTIRLAFIKFGLGAYFIYRRLHLQQVRLLLFHQILQSWRHLQRQLDTALFRSA